MAAVADSLSADTLLSVQEESYLSIVWRRLRKHRLAITGMILMALMLLTVIVVPLITPDEHDPPLFGFIHNPYDQVLANRNALPSREHLMGTDDLGRDVLTRLIFAGRISLFIAFSVVFVQETTGALVGAISGYYGGWVDAVIQRFVEFMITLPILPLLLALSATLRGIEIPFLPSEWSSAVVIAVILAAFGWMGATRLVRGMVLSLRNQDFTAASKALGLSDAQIIIRHMIPNALAPVIVSATLGLGGVIILESALSFLGFGIQEPIPTWGNMLQKVQADMWTQPYKAFYPGLCIFLASLAFNYIGDGLRDALDPRLKQ